MRFAFSVPTSDREEQVLLFSQFQGAGYDGLQLKRGQFQDYVDNPSRFRDEWGDRGGIASGLIVAGELDENGVSQLRRLIGFANAVASERIIFCHSRPRQEVSTGDIREYAAVLSELGKEARQHGTYLSLHHHYNQPVMYRDDFEVFFESVPDGSVGLTLDTAHLVKSGINDVAGVIRDFGAYIDNFHLKDLADGEFRVLGEGDIDFSPVFSQIRAINFDGWLCADEESGGDINETLAHSYQFMRSGFDTA